jgi:hypothetical protein
MPTNLPIKRSKPKPYGYHSPILSINRLSIRLFISKGIKISIKKYGRSLFIRLAWITIMFRIN